MYLQNKYTRIYNSIIEQAKSRTLSGYTETHHIIPKSLGGSNNADNLVPLTAREHFICHRLLTKMTEGEGWRCMTKAVRFMSHNKSKTKHITNGRTYQYLREQNSLAQTGEKNHFYGKKHTKETRAIISAKSKGQRNHCVPHSEEAKAKIAAGVFKGKCPHCGKEGRGNLMKRWHFDNCKHKGD
jgi:5-methylcytosine-specific restriction endonuclease McrA